jgi:hypothetical protein
LFHIYSIPFLDEMSFYVDTFLLSLSVSTSKREIRDALLACDNSFAILKWRKEIFFIYKVLIFWMIRFFPSPVSHSQSICLLFTILYGRSKRDNNFFSYIYSAPFLDETSFSVTSSLLFLYLHLSEKFGGALSCFRGFLRHLQRI